MHSSPASKPILTYTLLALGIISLGTLVQDEIRIFAVTATSIGLIILDERTRIERIIEDRIKISIREFWVPTLLFVELLILDLIDLSTLRSTIHDKGDILAFILAFALIAEGLRDSGLVTYLAYRFAERCRGNTHRLILYLFVLASVLTYVTSNDIVILALTPIIFSVALQARIRNARMLLLAQFVAANTVSMGLLIGSPTNIIAGDILNINFFEYALVMAVPAIYSFIISFLVIDLLNTITEGIESRKATGIQRFLPRNWSTLIPAQWGFQSTYMPPKFSDYRHVTDQMKRWITLFALAVLVLAINTLVNRSLYFTAFTIAASSTILRRHERKLRNEQRDTVPTNLILRLPFGIIPFGLVFFAIANRLSRASIINDAIVPFLKDISHLGSPVPSLLSITGSGAVVNLLNDLPAAALTGEIIGRVDFAHQLDEMQTVVGLLTGLNIGTYVTPIGALAGIIWFGILKRMSDDFTHNTDDIIDIPRRKDLVIYGTFCFVISTISLSIVHYAWIGVVNFAIGPSSNPDRIDFFGPWYVFVPALLFAIALPIVFQRRLAHNGVALLHVADLFSIITRIRFWVLANRFKFVMLAALILFSSCSGALLAVELYSAQVYDLEARFSNAVGFLSWFAVFIASGFEQQLFPRSLGGILIGAVAALGSIGTLVYLGRVVTDEPLDRLRTRIASGLIPSQRILLVNITSDHLVLIDQIIKRTKAFLICITKSDHVDRLDAYFDARPSRGFVVDSNTVAQGERTLRDHGIDSGDDWEIYYGASDALLLSLDPLSVDQIFLLSNSMEDDLLNVSVINLLEDATSSISGSRSAEPNLADFPEILCQMSNSRSLELVKGDARARLTNHVSKLVDDNCFGRYLYSEIQGPISYVDDFFVAGPSTPRVVFENQFQFISKMMNEPLDLSLEHGSDVNADTSVRRILLERLRTACSLPANSIVCGLETIRGDTVERVALGTYIRDTRVGGDARVDTVCGAVAVQICESQFTDVPGPVDSGERPFDIGPSESGRCYVVVGSSSSSVEALRALSNVPSIDLMFICPASFYVPIDVREDLHISVMQYESATEAATIALDLTSSGGRIVVFDGELSLDPWVDRFLSALSEMRLNMTAWRRDRFVRVATQHGWKIPAFRNYFIDEVLDTSWLMDSYFRVFVTVLYETISHSRRFSYEARTHVGMEIAHEVAIGLRPFMAWRAGDLETLSSYGDSSISLPGMSLRSFARCAESADNPYWEIVGIARISLEEDSSGRLSGARVRILPKVMPDAEPDEVDDGHKDTIEETDIVLGVPYL